jgi:hypothetical protein
MKAERALWAVGLWLAVSGCDTGTTTTTGVVGSLGKARFTAESDLVFSDRMVVGSHFTVKGSEVATEDHALIVSAHFESDGKVVVVDTPEVGAGVVHVAAPGSGELRLVDTTGTVLDSLPVLAANAADTSLVDGALLAVTSEIDARLPSHFAVTTRAHNQVLVSATDKCGGGLLDLHASTIEGAQVTVTDSGPAGVDVATDVNPALDGSLTLKTPGLDPLAYVVDVVAPGDVDESRITATSTTSTTVNLWGRGFTNDVEVVGLGYAWSSDPRVTLSAASGLVTTATPSFPAEGEPADTRPATVSVETLGEKSTLDLLALQSSQVATTRAAPPTRTTAVKTASAASCGTTCDPASAALLFGGALSLRRLRRLSLGRLRA